VTESLPGAPWPPVSVIVATRDRPKLLERAVVSILGQSYPGILECVVVFDQSEPSGLDVEVPGGRELRIMANTRTPGLAGARNSGIKGAAGPIIALCDDDDTWLPDKLTMQVDLLQKSGADLVACGVRIHHADHAVVRIPPAEVGLDQLARSRVTALHPSTFVMRQAVLEELGLIDEDIPGCYGEDYDLLLRAARRGAVLSVQEPLVDVFWHEHSFFAERWQMIADALRYMLNKHPELLTDRIGRARMEGQIAFAEAALAKRRNAWSSSWQALRRNPRERRAYLALAVSARVVPASSIVRAANRRGHGI
jgi:GT2 family glycosyltransferase